MTAPLVYRTPDLKEINEGGKKKGDAYFRPYAQI